MNFQQKLNCTYKVSSKNSGNYVISIKYGDGNSLNQMIKDGTYFLNYTYALAGSYIVSVNLISANYTISQTVINNPGKY